MNELSIKKGSVMDTPYQVIAHQVNCQGVMGAGVAKVIRQTYPQVFNEYKDFCDAYDGNTEVLLGRCQIVECYDGKFVANIFGQDSYGTFEKQTNYKKMHKSLNTLRKFMEERGLLTISFPYLIGCGLAGGDEDVVISIIKDVFDDSNIIYNFYDIN